MKIAVIGANGKAGKLIVKEAVERGIDTTAITHSENKSVAKNAIQKDLFSLTKEDLKDFDVVVTAFGAWTPETLPQHTTSLQHLADLLSGSEKRLIAVGGAGSLYVDEKLTTQLSQTPDFPKDYLPVATAMAKGLKELRKRNDVKWTYISPAAEFIADGEKTGEYILAGEVFTVNEKGESAISYADYAVAFVDEIEKGNHIQERISVLGK